MKWKGCLAQLTQARTYGLAALQVIPALQGDATDQTPPDLPSYLFKERIVYLVSIGARALCDGCVLTSAWWTE